MPQCAHASYGEYRPWDARGHYEYGQRAFVSRRSEYLEDGWRARNRRRRLDLEAEFGRLAELWLAETAHFSSLPKMVMHPAHQQIIGMGREALGPMLRWMRRGRPGYWFWALETIARETPVTAKMGGRVKEMKRAWIEWGEERGLV